VGDALGKLLPLGVKGEPIAAEFGLETTGELKAPPAPSAAPGAADGGEADEGEEDQ
jgi:hypothetical protein